MNGYPESVLRGHFADSNPLRFQVDLEFVDTEGSRRAAEQLARQPTQREGLGNRVTLEYSSNTSRSRTTWTAPWLALSESSGHCSHVAVLIQSCRREFQAVRPA